MQDDTQNDNLSPESSTTPDERSSGPEGTAGNTTFMDADDAASTSQASRAPAATASSYRDIIAERLARKSQPTGGQMQSARPAHASDVENSPVRARMIDSGATPKASPSRETGDGEAGGQLSELIEADTRSLEISGEASGSTSSGAEAPISSRERARLRQQERAELRRGGAQKRPAFEPDESDTQSASTGPETPEIPTADDVVAPAPRPELIRREPRRFTEEPRSREEPQAESRPMREARPPREARAERPEREPRQEREPRTEPRGEREPRPEREARPERTPRPERAERERAEREPRGDRPEQPRREARDAGADDRSDTSSLKPRLREEGRPSGPRDRPPIEGKAPLSDLKGGEPKQTERASDAARAMASKTGISVVVPLYNEQDSLRELTAALKQQLVRLAGSRYEIIYVNDGSTDRSGEILHDILATSSRVTALTFRRNQGKSAGLAAGFAEAQYGIVITMDADLQDDPREFSNLIAKLAEGYDLVSGWKKKRHDPMTKTGPSKFFNGVTSFFSGIKLHDFNCGLKAYRKEVTDSLNVYGEMHRYLPALAHWQGFRVTEIPVVHHPRKFGKSKFGSSRFFKGFLDLLTIVFTNRYGKRPLHLFGTIGTLLAFVGLVIDAWVSVEWITGQTALSNRPILLLGILLILVGVQLVSLGLLGEMIVKYSNSKLNLAVQKEKGRPSAEARERHASRMAERGSRPGRPPGSRPPSSRPPGSGERRSGPRRSS